MQVEQIELTILVMDDDGIILEFCEDDVCFGTGNSGLRAWEMDTLEVDAPVRAGPAILGADLEQPLLTKIADWCVRTAMSAMSG